MTWSQAWLVATHVVVGSITTTPAGTNPKVVLGSPAGRSGAAVVLRLAIVCM